MTLASRCRFYGHGKNETTDCPVSDIKIIDVTAHGNKNPEGKGKGLTMGKIRCQKSCPCHGIQLENVVHVDKLFPADAVFDCTEAYGTWTNVSPAPQYLRHEC